MIFPVNMQDNQDRGNKVNGVMLGIVTNNKDPEKLGRVKVKLPLREQENETDWIRIATLMAGKDRGSVFIPEVGDEVLLAFHLGEIRHPYVIGCLWTKDDKMPEADGDKNNIRKFTSRSGHEIIFQDDSADDKIILKTKKGQTIELADKADTITIKEKSGNNSIEIKGGSANEITVKSSTSKLTMNAKGDIEISSSKGIKVKSTQINIEASANLELKANAQININSSGMVNIKGSMVKIN